MSGRNIQHFDRKLLDHIKFGEDKMAKSLIKKNNGLVNASDDRGTLLHYAAIYDNAEITRELIKMGAEVDCLNSDSRTALMIAVQRNRVDAVDALLEANASIDLVDAQGQTAMQMMFASASFESLIFKAFVRRFRTDSSTDNEFFGKLITAGTSMYHTIFLNDTTVMKGLLERGLHVDSKSGKAHKMTALHIVAGLNDLKLAKWLLDNNADINAVDAEGFSPLGYATVNIRVDMVHLLLEHGANPNSIECGGVTPLCLILVSVRRKTVKDVDRCIELLLEYGATLQQTFFNDRSILELALDLESPKIVKLLIAHLAILEKLGISTAETFMSENIMKHPKMLMKLRSDYEKCKQSLESKIYSDLTLFDLINESEQKMRILVRNQLLMSQIKRMNCRLSRSYPWYFKLLKKQTSEAIAIMELEDEAIIVLCQVLNSTYNQCHYFAREIVGYLSERDLEQLCLSVQD